MRADDLEIAIADMWEAMQEGPEDGFELQRVFDAKPRSMCFADAFAAMYEQGMEVSQESSEADVMYSAPGASRVVPLLELQLMRGLRELLDPGDLGDPA